MSDCSTKAFSLPEAPLAYVDELMRENRELRELIRDLCRQLRDGWNEEVYREYMASEGFDKRVEELGIEVEE